jgi:Zn-dependent M28 family amino/carboxypeptidase
VLTVKRSLLAGSTALALGIAAALASPAFAATPTDSTTLRNAVTLAGVRAHQQEFNKIAQANGGTRVAGSPGHVKSAEYVFKKLTDAGYAPVRQEFKFPFFQETATPLFAQVSPDAKTYAVDSDFTTMEYSGSGDVTAPIQPTNDIVIPPGPTASSSNSGCEAADFAGFTAGNIALIQRGTCTFQQKALNAIAAGASGVVIFNEGQSDRSDLLNGTLGSPDGQTKPVIGTTFALGEALYKAAKAGTVTVHLVTTTTSEIRSTYNLYADTSGRADRTVVVGAHLDSVAEGPGINDNGSGSATDLEVAIQLKKLNIQPVNRVRFAWWSAEEEGLLGSQYYVNQLTAGDVKNTMANLNFDMVGSPNPVRFVYDGDGSSTPLAGPNGSKNIEALFTDYFGGQKLATDPTAFDGRSDYGPFIAAGIPAGGLFTGAEENKTAAQAAVYGGTAGEPYDPCYHQACDNFKNNNDPALDQMSDAVAHVTLQLAMTTSAVNGTDKASATAKQNADKLLYSGGRLRK